MNASMRVVVALAAASLVLTACSSGSSNDDAGSSSAAPAPTAKPSASVEPSVREDLDPGEGEVIIPGSIDSTTQELSAACDAAVAPLRALASTYPNMFSMTPADTEKFNAELPKAREACGGEANQEWVDFYTLELAGWMYGENPDAAKP